MYRQLTIFQTTLSRFVAWMNGLSIFQIKVSNKYTGDDFDDDLRSVFYFRRRLPGRDLDNEDDMDEEHARRLAERWLSVPRRYACDHSELE